MIVAGVRIEEPRSRTLWLNGDQPGEMIPTITRGGIFSVTTRDGLKLPWFVHRVHGAKGWTVSWGGFSILSAPRSSKKLAVLAALSKATEHTETEWARLLNRNEVAHGLTTAHLRR